MTATTRELCGVLGAALQVSGVERHAARLVRDGYLPRANEEVDERDAAILLLAVAAAPDPAQATAVVEALSSLGLRFLSRKVAFFVALQCDDDDRALMPGNMVDAVAEALEYETFNCTPGFQISRLSVQRGGQNAVLDAHMRLPGEVRDYCAQYGEDNPLSFGIQFNAVVPATVLRAVACALHPQTERGRQKPMLSLVTH